MSSASEPKPGVCASAVGGAGWGEEPGCLDLSWGPGESGWRMEQEAVFPVALKRPLQTSPHAGCVEAHVGL